MDSLVQKAHFYRRAGFGATLAELEASTTPQQLLDQWLQDQQPVLSVPLSDSPQFSIPPGLLGNRGSETDRRQARRQLFQQVIRYVQQFQAQILEQMVLASNPLHERVTTIWRDHFVVALQQTRPQILIRDYDLRLRQHALGDFRELLWSVSTSPAMMVYLDNQSNQVGNINENFSRELLELFTIGPGEYTEADIQEGARALTGWKIPPRRQLIQGESTSVFQPQLHDQDLKTYLGQTGAFNLDDIVDILANHPSTAKQISTLLWTEFVYPNPEPEIVDRLARVFTTQQRSIAALVEAIFNSPEFYSDRAYRSRLKNPLYFTAGSIHQLNLQADYPQILGQLRTMGQPIYNPPTVKGWPDDQGWMNSATLLNRINVAQQMTDDYSDEGGYSFDPSPFQTQDLITVLLDNNPTDGILSELSGRSTREVAALILASPTYQLV